MAKIIKKLNKKIHFDCLYGVIESGSNTNGSWIKYGDGNMICFAYKSISSTNFNTVYGAVYNNGNMVTIDFPQTFISNPVVTATIYLHGGLGSFTLGRQPTTTNFTGWMTSFKSYDFSNIGCGIYYTAIGRWK